MPDFTDGVKDYVTATAVITNYFPIDLKGNPDLSCYQCRYFSRSTGVCYITKDVTPKPQTAVGRTCPFRAGQQEQEGE